MDKIFEGINYNKLIISAVILVAAVIIWIVIKRLVKRFVISKEIESREQGKRELHVRTVVNIIKYVIGVLAAISILRVYGVNVTSFLAGLGIASAIAGLALQDLLKDMIMGANILTDSFFVIGDVVKYKDIEGVVVAFTVKTTKIKSIYTNDVLTVCNRNISEITKVSTQFDITVPLAYEESSEKIDKVLDRVCKKAARLEEINDCLYLGMDAFESSDVLYRVRVFGSPQDKPSIRRNVIRLIWDELQKDGITIPYEQLEISEHGKKSIQTIDSIG